MATTAPRRTRQSHWCRLSEPRPRLHRPRPRHRHRRGEGEGEVVEVVGIFAVVNVVVIATPKRQRMLSMDLVDNGQAVTGDNLDAATEKLRRHWLRGGGRGGLRRGGHLVGDVGTTQLLELHHGGGGWRPGVHGARQGAADGRGAARGRALASRTRRATRPCGLLEAVGSFSAAQRASLWKFTTGTSRVSVAGNTDGGGGSGSQNRAAITVAYGGGPGAGRAPPASTRSTCPRTRTALRSACSGLPLRSGLRPRLIGWLND